MSNTYSIFVYGPLNDPGDVYTAIHGQRSPPSPLRDGHYWREATYYTGRETWLAGAYGDFRLSSNQRGVPVRGRLLSGLSDAEFNAFRNMFPNNYIDQHVFTLCRHGNEKAQIAMVFIPNPSTQRQLQQQQQFVQAQPAAFGQNPSGAFNSSSPAVQPGFGQNPSGAFNSSSPAAQPEGLQMDFMTEGASTV